MNPKRQFFSSVLLCTFFYQKRQKCRVGTWFYVSVIDSDFHMWVFRLKKEDVQ